MQTKFREVFEKLKNSNKIDSSTLVVKEDSKACVGWASRSNSDTITYSTVISIPENIDIRIEATRQKPVSPLKDDEYTARICIDHGNGVYDTLRYQGTMMLSDADDPTLASELYTWLHCLYVGNEEAKKAAIKNEEELKEAILDKFLDSI